MKKIIALVLSLMMLMGCTAALAETAQKESLAVLKVNGAFDIQYTKLPDDYQLTVIQQDDNGLYAYYVSTDSTKPFYGIGIGFNDAWAEVEKFNDVSQEDIDVIEESFYEVDNNWTFETKETAHGTKLLIAVNGDKTMASVYTIYLGHEIEVQIIPGAGAETITEENIDTVINFLSDMDFVALAAE